MHEIPLVTIVTPVFNQSDYVEETINSLLNQTYKNIEYIVIDDGSTDNSYEVISKFDGRIKIIKKANSGQSDTLNFGWNIARGKYLGYLSSDDCLKPEAISILVEALVNENANVVYCDYDLIDGDSNFIRTISTENFDKKKLCIDLVCIPGPGVLFEKKLFDELGGWESKLKQIPDYAFWVKLSDKANFYRVDKSLARFRIHDESASYRKMSRERINEIVEFVSKNKIKWATNSEERIALLNANIKSARLSAQSGDLLYLFRYLYAAFRINPVLAISPSKIWFVMKGYLRRVYYKFQFSTKLKK